MPAGHLPQKEPDPVGLGRVVYPYLLRNLEIGCCNQVWEVGITYIPLERGFVYLTAIIDVHSRFVVT
ncbi:hypothetical protein [Pontibacter russatus]|uniref:hypothetical protein n=1 Tax=Pontibacter russatus TaxID=2694929 RepID=UPI00137B616C|nr:hypothetical protein [Pontibacter russatus]